MFPLHMRHTLSGFASFIVPNWKFNFKFTITLFFKFWFIEVKCWIFIYKVYFINFWDVSFIPFYIKTIFWEIISKFNKNHFIILNAPNGGVKILSKRLKFVVIVAVIVAVIVKERVIVICLAFLKVCSSCIQFGIPKSFCYWLIPLRSTTWVILN